MGEQHVVQGWQGGSEQQLCRPQLAQRQAERAPNSCNSAAPQHSSRSMPSGWWVQARERLKSTRLWACMVLLSASALQPC